MKILYSFLSVVLTLLIVAGIALIDVFVAKDAIVAGLEIINKNFFDFNVILFVILLDFLCAFGIISVLYVKKNSKLAISSLFASSLAIIFFTLFFGRFGIVKNFYFISNEFSQLVRSAFRNIGITNFSLSALLILLTILYFIRRNKDEKGN